MVEVGARATVEGPPVAGTGRVHLPALALAERVHDDGHLLLWQARGAATLRLDGAEHDLVEGYAQWVPAGVRHAIIVHADSVLLPVFVEASLVATSAHRAARLAVDDDLRALCLAYVQGEMSILRPSLDVTRQILAVVERLVAETPGGSGAPGGPSRVRPPGVSAPPLPAHGPARVVAEALRFDPGDDRTVAELSAAAHACSRTVERAFRAQTGMTWQRWRIGQRMAVAADLLASSSSVGAVARRVGYADVSAFGRVFKAYVGTTPAAYAAARRPLREAKS